MKRSMRHIMGRSIRGAAAVRQQEKSLRSDEIGKRKLDRNSTELRRAKKKTLNLALIPC
jgi:hypothetical protein